MTNDRTNLTKNASTVKSQSKRQKKIYTSWRTESPGVYDMLPECNLRCIASKKILHLISSYLIHTNMGGKYCMICIDDLYILKK